MDARQSQIIRVLEYLEANESITSQQAFELGVTRLSSIIFRLRRRGYDIISVPTEDTNRYGDRCNFATYRMVKDDG